MVAEHALGAERADPAEDPDRVGAAVEEVAEEHEPVSGPGGDRGEQVLELGEAPVHVADDDGAGPGHPPNLPGERDRVEETRVVRRERGVVERAAGAPVDDPPLAAHPPDEVLRHRPARAPRPASPSQNRSRTVTTAAPRGARRAASSWKDSSTRARDASRHGASGWSSPRAARRSISSSVRGAVSRRAAA